MNVTPADVRSHAPSHPAVRAGGRSAMPRGHTPMAVDPVAEARALVRLCEAATLEAGLCQLASALMADGRAEQVWIGLPGDDGGSRVIVGWPQRPDDLVADNIAALSGAMDESIEQAVAIAVPESTDARHAVHLEHRALQTRLSRAVATVPLGRRGEPVLAVTLVRAEPFGTDELVALADRLGGVAAAVLWMKRAEQPWHRRALDGLRRRSAEWQRPGALGRRRGWTAGAAALLLLGTVPVDDQVRGAARIEGEQQRVLSAPADGFVKSAYVRPGDLVQAGDVLLDLVDADLRLERERWSAQVTQHENAYAAAMAKSERGAAATALARAAEAQAQVALAEGQLLRGRLVAPFNALVIQGDWSQSAGAPVRQGDALLTLATQGRQRIVVEVDEVDIERIRVGQTGTLSLSGWAFRDEPLVVERIAPMARAANGHNVFDVQARLLRPDAALRPGLVGRADLHAGRAPWLWSTARDVLLRLRLTLWRWWA